MSHEHVLVSACLLGVRCRFDGGSRPSQRVKEMAGAEACAPVCPEQLGGLPTPRPAARLVGGDGRAVLAGRAKVVAGADATDAFRRGADECLRLAEALHVKRAFLKQGSPSCGYGRVEVDGRETEGVGVTAAALEAAGTEIVAVD